MQNVVGHRVENARPLTHHRFAMSIDLVSPSGGQEAWKLKPFLITICGALAGFLLGPCLYNSLWQSQAYGLADVANTYTTPAKWSFQDLKSPKVQMCLACLLLQAWKPRKEPRKTCLSLRGVEEPLSGDVAGPFHHGAELHLWLRHGLLTYFNDI